MRTIPNYVNSTTTTIIFTSLHLKTGTTFHVAIFDKSVQFYDEMNTNMHDIHRHDFMTVVSKTIHY